MQQICVIGLGLFGTHLARSLASMHCEVIAVDSDENQVAQIRDHVQHAVIANARNFNDLQAVVPPDIDMAVVAFGEYMEASILCAMHLRKLGVKHIMAKANDLDHADILKLIGVDEVIFPEQYTAERIARRMVMPNYLDFLPIAENFQVVELNVPTGFLHKTLGDLHLRNRYKIMVLAVKRNENDVTFMPGASFTLEPSDIIVIVGRKDDIKKFSKA